MRQRETVIVFEPRKKTEKERNGDCIWTQKKDGEREKRWLYLKPKKDADREKQWLYLKLNNYAVRRTTVLVLSVLSNLKLEFNFLIWAFKFQVWHVNQVDVLLKSLRVHGDFGKKSPSKGYVTERLCIILSSFRVFSYVVCRARTQVQVLVLCVLILPLFENLPYSNFHIKLTLWPFLSENGMK